MSRPARLLVFCASTLPVIAVLWLVGWNDRVTDTDGERHTGRVRTVEPTFAVFESGEVVPIEDPRSVERGLAGALDTLAGSPVPFLAGLLMHLLGVLTTFLRWWLLLRGVDLSTPLREVVRLGWVGNFFASVIPGGVAGGDVVKSVYIARAHPGLRTRAIVTVVMDRLVGLGMLGLIAGVAVLAAPEVGKARGTIGTIVAVGGAAVIVFLLLRRRLPRKGVLGEVRIALETYGARKKSVFGAGALALASHSMLLGGFFFYGKAIGIDLPLIALGAAIPVAQMLAAVPALPGGWGVGDFAFFFFLPLAGVPAGPAVALSFVYRISHTLLSLPGGFILAPSAWKVRTEKEPETEEEKRS